MEKTYSWLDQFPCGTYITTKKGRVQVCNQSANVTAYGLGKILMDGLYKTGIMVDPGDNVDSLKIIEKFNNGGLNTNLIFIVLIMIILFYLTFM